jgi:hypothetical protein
MRNAKTAAALLAALLIFGVMTSAAQEAGPPAEGREGKKGFGPLEKSLLIPGWGQISKGRWLEGALFLGLEAFCLLSALHENRLGNEAYRLYQAASTTEDAVLYRSDTESRDARRNRLLLAGAAVWALNLLDIHLIIKGKEGPSKLLSLRMGTHEAHALVVVAGCRF